MVYLVKNKNIFQKKLVLQQMNNHKRKGIMPNYII